MSASRGEPIPKRTRTPAANAISDWVDSFIVAEGRGLGLRQFGAVIDLPGIRIIRRKTSERISQNSIEKIKKGADLFNATPDERVSLTLAIERVVQESIARKGVAPTLIRKHSRTPLFRDGERVYKDNDLAADIHEDPKRIARARLTLGILTTEYGEADVERIKAQLTKNTEKKDELPQFAESIAGAVGISTKELKDLFGHDCAKAVFKGWNTRDPNIPTAEQLGGLLVPFQGQEEVIAKIVEVWLTEYRRKITLADIGRERKISRTAMLFRARSIGIRDTEHLSWEEIEALRVHEYPKAFQQEKKEPKEKKAPLPKIKTVAQVVRKPHEKSTERSRETVLFKSTKTRATEGGKGALPQGAAMPRVKIESNFERVIPDVLTGQYLASLTPTDAKVVQKLRGSTMRNPVRLGKEGMLIEYMMREHMNPPGAKFRKTETGEYYFEYVQGSLVT